MAIATYAAASGAYVIMGVHNPVDGSAEVTHILGDVWEKKVGGSSLWLNPVKSCAARWSTSTRSARAPIAGLYAGEMGPAATGVSKSCPS